MFEDVDEGHVDGDTTLHFFYNREERIKNAPKIVQDYYAGKMDPPRGFFKVLVSTRANKFLFLTMVVLAAFATIYTKVSGNDAAGNISGVKCELVSFAYDEEVFTSIKTKCSEESLKDPRVMKVHFYLSDADSQAAFEEETELLIDKTEDYIRLRTQDFEITKVRAVVNIGSESAQLECRVKR